MFSNLFVVLYRDRKNIGPRVFRPQALLQASHHRYDILLSAVETRESLIQPVGRFSYTHTRRFLGRKKTVRGIIRARYMGTLAEEKRRYTNFLYSGNSSWTFKLNVSTDRTKSPGCKYNLPARRLLLALFTRMASSFNNCVAKNTRRRNGPSRTSGLICFVLVGAKSEKFGTKLIREITG